jgi:hypothetical protein
VCRSRSQGFPASGTGEAEIAVNKAEYARHRGCSPKQVRRALALGWITVDANAQIDPVTADRSWAAAADPAHPRGRSAGQSSTYIDARLAALISTTELRGLKLKEERARLVSAKDATEAILTLADRARASWEPWAARVAPMIAHDLNADAELVRKVLGHYVKQHVASLPPLVIELR